jgi:hypothetical protein
MRIAFDIHGTLDSDQKIRDFVILLNKDPNYEVFIISGPPTAQLEVELEILGLNTLDVLNIISVVDFLKDNGVEMWKDNGNWWCGEEIWWESKGLICNEYHIDIIFDDKIRYKKYMPDFTKFVLWIG